MDEYGKIKESRYLKWMNEGKFANKELNKATAKIIALAENVRRSAFATAAIIAQVEANKYYLDDGFKSGAEWASKTFGFAKTAAYNMARIGAEFITPVMNEKNKITGFISKLVPETATHDYTTTQIVEIMPLGVDNAIKICQSGEITPDMSCKAIREKVKAILNPEAEAEAEAEAEEMITLYDENGITYVIPASIASKYKAIEG